jgi:hypothetical protein
MDSSLLFHIWQSMLNLTSAFSILATTGTRATPDTLTGKRFSLVFQWLPLSAISIVPLNNCACSFLFRIAFLSALSLNSLKQLLLLTLLTSVKITVQN